VEGQCASRDRQSPIDFDALFVPADKQFNFFYNDVHTQNITLVNDGNTLHVDATGQGFGGITMPVQGHPWYNLKSIQFRAKSEHTFRGKHTPMEIQLIHQTSTIQDPTFGPDLTIVSIPIVCDTPPAAKEVFAGLQQPDGPADEALARIEKEVGFSDAPHDDDDDRLAEAQAEIGLVHSLASASHSARYRGHTARNATGYKAPPKTDPGFNPVLQFFVEQQPPVLDQKVEIALSSTLPLRLSSLLAGGTFFSYSGSQTVPPCDQKVNWFVRRDPIKASNAQVKVLFDSIFKVTNQAGNFRTVMPLNQRPIEIMTAIEEPPAPAPFTVMPPMGPPFGVDDDRESKFIDWAKDSITISKSALDYAKELSARLLHASKSHADALKPEHPEDWPTAQPSTTPWIPDPPRDNMWGMNEIAQTLGDAVKVGIAKTAAKLPEQVNQLTKSLLRQELLKRAGLTPPPPDAASR